MSKTIADAVARVQALVGAIDGITSAPTTLPGKLSRFPTAIIYPGPGTWTTVADAVKRFEGELTLELHVPSGDLGRESDKLLGYVESVVNELADDPTLNNTVQTIQWPIRFDGLVGRVWNGVETLAYVWHIPIRMENTIT